MVIFNLVPLLGTGSGLRSFYYPGSAMFFYGSQTSDSGSQTHIFDSLMANFWDESTIIFCVLAIKILNLVKINFFAIL